MVWYDRHSEHAERIMHNISFVTKPLIILIRGIPGSGKSYLASHLAKTFRNDEVVLLDPDTIDQKSECYRLHSVGQLSEGVDPKLLPYRFLRSKACLGIQEGKIIIWNQPFTDVAIFQKMTDRFKQHAKEHQQKLGIVVVEVKVNPQLAQQRVQTRKDNGGHGPSQNTFTRFVQDFTRNSLDGYQKIEVDGTASIDDSIQKILSAITHSPH